MNACNVLNIFTHADRSSILTNLQINLCLRNVSNLLDVEYFCLKMLHVHSQCMGIMHHRLAQKRR